MRGKQDEKGTVIVFIALMLPFLILFAGVAIDIGRAYLYKSYMQNAADAAALLRSILKQLHPLLKIFPQENLTLKNINVLFQV